MKDRLKELDALRGIAAIIVVLYHLSSSWDAANLGFKFGWIGVELFFIISSFVTTMTIENCTTWKDFVVRRISRLYPAYWACVTITFLMIYVTIRLGINHDYEENLLKKYLINLTMLQHFFQIQDLDSPYWTLTIELVFYLFMILIFVLKALKNIEKIGFIVILMVLLYGSFFEQLHTCLIINYFEFIFPLISYFPLFFIGIILYKIKFDRPTIQRIFMITLCVPAQVLMFENTSHFKGFISIQGYLILFFCILFLFTLFLLNRLNFIVNRYTCKLGDISYSLYLIHNYVGIKIIIYLQEIYGINLWLGFIIALIFVISLAILINQFIEKPAQGFIRSKYQNWKKNKQINTAK